MMETDLPVKDISSNNTKIDKVDKKFSKNAFLKSGKYSKDIINAILEDDKCYTLKEVDYIIKNYLNGRVI